MSVKATLQVRPRRPGFTARGIHRDKDLSTEGQPKASRKSPMSPFPPVDPPKDAGLQRGSRGTISEESRRDRGHGKHTDRWNIHV